METCFHRCFRAAAPVSKGALAPGWPVRTRSPRGRGSRSPAAAGGRSAGGSTACLLAARSLLAEVCHGFSRRVKPGQVPQQGPHGGVVIGGGPGRCEHVAGKGRRRRAVCFFSCQVGRGAGGRAAGSDVEACVTGERVWTTWRIGRVRGDVEGRRTSLTLRSTQVGCRSSRADGGKSGRKKSEKNWPAIGQGRGQLGMRAVLARRERATGGQAGVAGCISTARR